MNQAYFYLINYNQIGHVIKMCSRTDQDKLQHCPLFAEDTGTDYM